MTKFGGVLSIFLAGAMLAATVSGQDTIVDDLYGRGVHAYNSHDDATAFDLLSQAIATGSEDPRAFYFRGLALVRLGRDVEGREDFQAGAKLEAASREKSAMISRSLERVQGHTRLELETVRKMARVNAVSKRQAAVDRATREFETGQSNVRRGREMPAARKPLPAVKPTEDPFGESSTPTPAEASPPAETPTPAPAAEAEQPTPAPAATPKEEPTADPFGDTPQPTPAEAPAAATPKPAPAEADPFGDNTPPAPDAPAAAPATKPEPAAEADPFAEPAVGDKPAMKDDAPPAAETTDNAAAAAPSSGRGAGAVFRAFRKALVGGDAAAPGAPAATPPAAAPAADDIFGDSNVKPASKDAPVDPFADDPAPTETKTAPPAEATPPAAKPAPAADPFADDNDPFK